MRGAIGYGFDTENPAGLYALSGNIFPDVEDDTPTESTIDRVFEEG